MDWILTVVIFEDCSSHKKYFNINILQFKSMGVLDGSFFLGQVQHEM